MRTDTLQQHLKPGNLWHFIDWVKEERASGKKTDGEIARDLGLSSGEELRLLFRDAVFAKREAEIHFANQLFYKGKTCSEIADLLDLSQNMVRVRVGMAQREEAKDESD